MELSERAEEILERLWEEQVENKNQNCSASMLKDDDALKELVDNGYLTIKNDIICLNAKGREESKNCVRRHRLAERLFTDIIGIKKNLVHETSCKFEHLLHKGIDEHICTLLGHPSTCPQGRHIPPGNCCKSRRKDIKKLIMPLTEAEAGRKLKVAYIHSHYKGDMQKILAMGILPETDIRLIQKYPSYVFQSGKSQFAMDAELAGKIFVRVS